MQDSVGADGGQGDATRRWWRWPDPAVPCRIWVGWLGTEKRGKKRGWREKEGRKEDRRKKGEEERRSSRAGGEKKRRKKRRKGNKIREGKKRGKKKRRRRPGGNVGGYSGREDHVWW